MAHVSIGGDLALTITDGVVSVALSNPHGDVVATLPLNGDDAGAGITSWASFDEYGNLTSQAPANTGVNTYGWHGKSQRTLDGSGLILMGVLLYYSATGAFTSRDPIDGGNTTTYAYPQDPINQHDLNGLMAAAVLAGSAIFGVNAAAIFAAIGFAVVATIAAYILFRGVSWARSQVRQKYYNYRSKHSKNASKNGNRKGYSIKKREE